MAGGDSISYQSVADNLGVSVASVRNWVKCGYLELAFRGHVQTNSLDRFKKNIAGQYKLIARANKSLCDEHDHQELKVSISDSLNQGVSADKLSSLYERGLSSSFKNKEGIYYTPKNISDDFFNVIPFPVSLSTFCDPCCGTGNFIISAIDAGFAPENIWGYDTDPIAVDIAKARVYEKTGKHANIYRADFFKHADRKYDGLFDVIMTNPPWGKKLSKAVKASIAETVGAKRSKDTSSLFMLAAIQTVRHNGIVGMLLPESFLNIMTFQDAREAILSYKLLSVSCYGQPFKGILAKAKSLIIQKNTDIDGMVECKSPKSIFQRPQKTFGRNPNFIINASVGIEEDKALSRVFEAQHITLKKNAKWALGIVTGNNKRFISTEMKPGYIPVISGKNLQPDGITRPTAFIPNDFSMYQQVAPREMYTANSKIIYKFISSKIAFFHDTEGRYVLNSANILIPSEDIGIKHCVLADYFSSDFVNWIFRRIFDTHKVLRADLENIPIFESILSSSDRFDEKNLISHLGLEKEEDGTFSVKK